MRVIVRKLPKSEIEIEGELEVDAFEGYFKTALKRLGENLKLDGFRSGKIPENILLANIPEIRILEEMANMALSEHYPKILEGEKIDAISRTEISIIKLARNNPLGFKIKTAVLPTIKLPEYKTIAKKITGEVSDLEKNIAVTEKDLEDTIMDIRKSRAPKKHITSPQPSPGKGEGGSFPSQGKAGGEVELPGFNDEFFKILGPFKDIDKFEDYWKHLNKKVEDLRKEFRNDAEKKAKLALILNEIAKIEKIVADSEQIAKEVANILEHYKDADPDRARMHAENILTNEKIFQFLESQ